MKRKRAANGCRSLAFRRHPPAERLEVLAFDAELRRVPRPLIEALWAGVDALRLAARTARYRPEEILDGDLEAAVQRGYEPTLGFLRLLLDNVGEDRPLGLLTNDRLREFRATLDDRLHPGLPKLF